jgi:hypothetical protein
MAEPDVDLKGLLERNTPGLGHTTSYRLDNVTIEVDLSEVGVVDESLAEGLPVTVNGHFETQDNPETGSRWVFKAHRLHQEVAGGGAPLNRSPSPRLNARKPGTDRSEDPARPRLPTSLVQKGRKGAVVFD